MSGAQALTDHGAGFGTGSLVIVLVRPARERLAGVHQRFVVDDPGLSLRQFVYRRTGSDDLRDGHIVNPADRLGDVFTSYALAFIPSGSRARLPVAAQAGTQRLSGSR
jgi:hypothetical protein